MLKSILNVHGASDNYLSCSKRACLNILLKRAFGYLTVAFDGLKRNETIYNLCDEMRYQVGSN